MHSSTETHSTAASTCLLKQPRAAQRLRATDETEVRRFLAERPLQTFGLLGMISDNGLVSPYNRGDFYAYRGTEGQLEGVALMGYNTVIDARSEEAIAVFADLAKTVVNPFLILAREQQINRFIEYYADALYKCTTIDRYLLYKHGSPALACNPLAGVRQATMKDLEFVARAHARCGIEETGIDGLQLDAEGFVSRCARRIEHGSTWLWIEDGKLILKLEVLTATREIAYFESLWVDPQERGKGYGLRFVNQVSARLLQTSAAVCLLAQENNLTARRLYERAAYEVVDTYRVIFCNRDLNA
ncbi:MAG: GNAT family N-acetyltransferase [Blastocatellia bacterium]